MCRRLQFEHLKAYNKILERISTWLAPKDQSPSGESLLFVHVFCHKDSPYDFEEGSGWMADNFFSGGTMPSVSFLRAAMEGKWEGGSATARSRHAC